MMKRRFTTITTILAGALAGNTAFFATQTIATQEMQPTMQATDRYMIIDLAGIPLDQAQNNMDAQIPADTQLTEDSSSLSEQNESEMSMELVDQSESSVSEETLPLDLCQYFEHKKLKGYADFFNSSSSFCCGVI